MHNPRGFIHVGIAAAFCASALVAACSSSDKTTNPGGGNGGPTGALTAALAAVDTQFFVGTNAAVFRSLSFFAPRIAGVTTRVRAHHESLHGAEALVSCLAPGLETITFDYNGVTYEGTAITGAPPEGVRFLLYEVDAQGQVNLANQIGYLEIVCAGDFNLVSMTFRVVIGGSTVVDGLLTGSYPLQPALNVDGQIYGGGGSLPYVGQMGSSWPGEYITGDVVQLGFVPTVDFSASLTTIENSDSSLSEYQIRANSEVDPAWEVWTAMRIQDPDVITMGWATFDNRIERKTVACISGTLDNPVLTDPAVDSCTVEGTTNGTYPLGSVSDIAATYQILRSWHSTMRELLETVLSVVATPTG